MAPIVQGKNTNEINGQWKFIGIHADTVINFATVFQDCEYGSHSQALYLGNYKSQNINWGQNDAISSIKVSEGFKAILYDNDNFTGDSLEITSDDSCLFYKGWSDRTSSIKVKPNGITTLNGTYYIQNRKSGLVMDVMGGEAYTSDGINLIQWFNHMATNQQFTFLHLGDGVYEITAVHSGKAIDIGGSSNADGTPAVQFTYGGVNNEQFIVVPAENGFYKLIAKHSGKLLEVEHSRLDEGALIVQGINQNKYNGQWRLIDVNLTGIKKAHKVTTYLSPNPSLDAFTISFKESVSSISILDVLGTEVYNNKNVEAELIFGRSLKSGIYFTHISYQNGDMETIVICKE